MSIEEQNAELEFQTPPMDSEQERYLTALGSTMSMPLITYTAILLCLVVFGLMCLRDPASLQTPTSETLLLFGADFAPLTIDAHQWWRCLTSAFVHIGIWHIFCNLYTLYGFGNLVERFFGHLNFLLIYLGSAVTGSLLSLGMYQQEIISAGASGAVFGVFGALAAFLMQSQNEIPKPVFNSLLSDVKSFAFMGILLCVFSWVNNWAHLGGAIGGFVFGLIAAVPLYHPERKKAMRTRTYLLLIFISLVCVSGGAAVYMRNASRFPAFFEKYEKLESSIDVEFQKFLNGRAPETIPDEEYMRFVAGKLVPLGKKIHGVCYPEPKNMRNYQKPTFDFLKQCAAKRLTAYRMELRACQEPSEENQAAAEQAFSDLEDFMANGLKQN